MDIGRKDFFRKSLFSLGEAVLTVRDALKTPSETAMTLPDAAEFVSEPHAELLAVARNEYCLAKNSGCFACMERCDSGAITLVPGVGVRINPQLCTGCGTCEYICPVTPKAFNMLARTAIQTSSADQAEQTPQKGETPC